MKKMESWKTAKENEEEKSWMQRRERKKKKKIGKESPEVKVEKRASMQALSYQTIALNFAGISA